MMCAKYLWRTSALAFLLLAACTGHTTKETAPVVATPPTVEKKEDTTPHFKGTKVPVLCYHAIREILKTDSAEQKTYSVSPESFALQMKTLADHGYTTITPEQLREFYTAHKPLPEKPVMITFDDGRKDQVTIGAAEMEKYHFKGVFFIMTVSLGKKHYMSRDDVKALADKGHTIGCHTWDHHKVTGYKKEDWTLQLTKPKNQLEKITQQPVTSFAYPYGVWNDTAADSLKAHGFTTAFIFFGKQNAQRPLYTLERINVAGGMGIEKFLGKVEQSSSAD